MKALMIAASAAALSLTAAPAMAQMSGMYGSVGYAATDQGDAKLGAVQGRIGARLGGMFGVEGEGAFGIQSDDVDVGLGQDVEVKLNHQLAGYGVLYAPLSENFDLLARLGVGTQEIEADFAGSEARADGTSINYGVGGQFFFTPQDGIRADWTRHDFTDDDGGEIDVWAVSYVRKF